MIAPFFLLLFVTHAVILVFMKDLLFHKDFCDMWGHFVGVWFGFEFSGNKHTFFLKGDKNISRDKKLFNGKIWNGAHATTE